MNWTDEEFKKIYQQATRRSKQRPAACLTEEKFTRAASGEMNSREREQLADHLVTCSDCAEEYQIIQSLKPWSERVAAVAAEAPVEGKSQEQREGLATWVQTFWGRLMPAPTFRYATVLLLLVVVVGGSLSLWLTTSTPQEPIPVERGGESTPLRVDPQDRAVLRQPPTRFAWLAVVTADSYQVVLYDFESTPVWESGTVPDPSVQIPETVRENMERGTPYYWRVITLSGIDRRKSKLFQFTINADNNG